METRTWLTADTHFHHRNIVDYCGRPFRSSSGEVDVPYMNRELTRLWNETVAPLDTVYHLGDFAMGSRAMLAPTRARLNGRLVLIRGNHDRGAKTMLEAGFDEVHEELVVELEGKKLYLAHIPVPDPRKWQGAQYHLCGHVHTLWTRRQNIVNVGVDVWGYRPRSLAEVLSAANQGPMRVGEATY